MYKFDNSEILPSILPNDIIYSMRDNISQQPKKEENNLQKEDEDITSFDNFEYELLEPSKEPLKINSGNRESLC